MLQFNPRDPIVQGETLGDVVAFHRIPSDTEPLVHIRRSERPEIVLFGHDMPLQLPAVVFAGRRILIKSEGQDRLKVSYFTLGQDDRTEYCPNNLEAMIRTIVRLNGSYTDLVAAISDAKQKGVLAARVKFDALPSPGREYRLDADAEAAPDEVDPALLDESDSDDTDLAAPDAA
jgi:hypothetical protein